MRAGVTAFFGRSGTGKTSLMLRELIAYGHRALIFDPQRDEKLDRFPALSSASHVRGFFASADSYGPDWIRVVRGDLQLYEWVASSVKYWRGVVWVLDDSPGLFARCHALKLTASDVAIAGRHMGQGAGVELWAVAHRPVHLPTDVRSAVTRIRSFAQDEPRDLKYLAEKAGPTFAETVGRLRNHQFTRWPEDVDHARQRGRAAPASPGRTGLVRGEGLRLA